MVIFMCDCCASPVSSDVDTQYDALSDQDTVWVRGRRETANVRTDAKIELVRAIKTQCGYGEKKSE
jgi:hypothetical protein